MVTLSNQVVRNELKSPNHYSVHKISMHKVLIWDKYKMLDGDVLRDLGVKSTLIHSRETSTTKVIAVFNGVGDICMINSILRKH